MEVKKTTKADLDSKKPIFMQIGLVVVLSFVFIAFEWTFTEPDIDEGFKLDEEAVEEEIIPITRQEEVEPPPPPPPPKMTDVLNIVDDDVELDEELVIEDTEAMEDTEVNYTEFDMEEEDDNEGNVFVRVEEMPEFPGGQSALLRYLGESVKYPTIAKENGIQGRVYVQFIVNKDGSISDIEISRGVHPSLDKEAIRVARNMPAWKPGKQRDNPVRVSIVIPISFVLQ